MKISRDLTDLQPAIREKCELLIANCKAVGIDILITCTLRDAAAQDWLYASGRTRKGKILTNARSGKSKHEFGLAFDFCVMTAGKCDWNNSEAFAKVGAMGEAVGLTWAGRWRGSLREVGHFEIDYPKTKLKE